MESPITPAIQQLRQISADNKIPLILVSQEDENGGTVLMQGTAVTTANLAANLLVEINKRDPALLEIILESIKEHVKN